MKTSLREMNARRHARAGIGLSGLGEGSKAQVEAILGLERATERKARDAEKKSRDAAAEKSARDLRVREEERRAVLARALKVPAGAERDRYLEEERLVTKAREAVARVKRGEVTGDVDASVFGIQFDD